jgi:hypothetical protein
VQATSRLAKKQSSWCPTRARAARERLRGRERTAERLLLVSWRAHLHHPARRDGFEDRAQDLAALGRAIQAMARVVPLAPGPDKASLHDRDHILVTPE